MNVDVIAVNVMLGVFITIGAILSVLFIYLVFNDDDGDAGW